MSEPSRSTLQAERFRQSLKVVPVHNQGVSVLPSETPEVLTLEVTLRYGPAGDLLRRFFKARTHRRYVLEGVGREVYEDIDGFRNFEQLIDVFAERHRLSFMESRALLAQYYQMLSKRGLIVATLPRK